MRNLSILRTIFGIVLVGTLTCVQAAFAANYPLELINPKPASAPGQAASSRIYRAYPALEYNIRAAVIGGAFPYTFALTNAPAGMSVDARGVIVWSNPQATATPTLTVRDSEGAQVTATWTIQVTPNGFRFVSATNGTAAPTGTGTLANPWRTMADVYHNAGTLDIVYFRAGTYNQLNLPRTTGGWERVEWGGSRPTTWLAYPGEVPIIDFGYQAGVENGPMIRIGDSDADGQSRPPYVDGFETRNSRIIGFQTGSAATFRRLKMHHLLVGGDGSNAAHIMTLTQSPPVVGMVIQDSEFYSAATESTTIKIYAQEKTLIEDTIHHSSYVGIELKDDVRRYTVRNNLFYNISRHAIGGNMHETGTTGEICFNTVLQAGGGMKYALEVNQDGMAGVTHIYRNTLVGRVRMRSAIGSNGPFYWNNNVIVSDDAGTPSGSHIVYENVSAPERIVVRDNLARYPSDNVVDSSGRLTAAYASYLGTHGSQVVGGVNNRPSAPTNLRVVVP